MQVARLLGAGRVIAAGRNHDALAEVTGLGADAVINTAVSDDALAEAFAAETGGGYDVVLDFLWGRPTELLLKALVPNRIGQSKPTRFVQAGESAGARIALTADSVRTSGPEIYGAWQGPERTGRGRRLRHIAQWTRRETRRRDRPHPAQRHRDSLATNRPGRQAARHHPIRPAIASRPGNSSGHPQFRQPADSHTPNMASSEAIRPLP